MLTREDVLAAELAAIDGWLHVRCACQHEAWLPLRLLARQHGALMRVAAVLPRLVCSRCRRRQPVLVEAVESPQAGAPGGPPAGWAVGLVP